MKKKLLMVMCVVVMTMAGCAGNDNEVAPETEVVEMTEQKDAEEHTHAYVEEVTTAATCEADGVKTFTCECGDSYTEAIPATGHVYENYVFNEDATYLADGTETATCSSCDLTDTRTAEGTKLEYTYTDVSATKYAKQSVNIRNLPSTDGERLGSLTMNQEVKVTGQCNETKWYRIEFGGSEAYVSNNYLVNEKIVVSQTPVAPGNDNTYSDDGNAGNVDTGSDNTDNGATSTPDSGSTDVGISTPEAAPTPEPTPSEPVKNPNNYPTATFADLHNGNLAPGTYYLTDTDQTVTVNPPIDGGQTENSSGVIIDGDTGEILNPGHP